LAIQAIETLTFPLALLLPMMQDDLASSLPRSLSQSNLSSESSAWILPSPHESDTSNRSAQYLAIPEPKARAVVSTAHNEKDKDEHQSHTPRRNLSRGSTTSSATSTQAIAGSTGGTDDSGMMIMPDDIIETGDFRYPTPETFGQSSKSNSTGRSYGVLISKFS
jgi:hypothetical protein